MPAITDECFVITGCGLSGVTSVDFGGVSLSTDGAFGDGSYTIVNDHRLEVCPPFCLDAGEYVIRYDDANGVLGQLDVEITTPVDPTLVCEQSHMVGTEQCVWVSSGQTPNTIQFVIFSPLNLPTVVPGVLSLDIGDQGTNYVCGPAVIGECEKRSIGTIPLNGAGLTLYFQTVLIDPSTFAMPYLTSNVCATTYF